jgi:hypothetical protein
MQQIKMPTHPCINCIYFKVCGETNRTEPCYGRVTKSQKKKEKQNDNGRTSRNP